MAKNEENVYGLPLPHIGLFHGHDAVNGNEGIEILRHAR